MKKVRKTMVIVAAMIVITLLVIEIATPDRPSTLDAPPFRTAFLTFSTTWYFVSRKPSRPRPCVWSSRWEDHGGVGRCTVSDRDAPRRTCRRTRLAAPRRIGDDLGRGARRPVHRRQAAAPQRRPAAPRGRLGRRHRDDGARARADERGGAAGGRGEGRDRVRRDRPARERARAPRRSAPPELEPAVEPVQGHREPAP